MNADDCVSVLWTSHPAVSSLSRVWNQDRTLELGRTQDGAALAQSEDSVPALQGRFGEETCSEESRSGNKETSVHTERRLRHEDVMITEFRGDNKLVSDQHVLMSGMQRHTLTHTQTVVSSSAVQCLYLCRVQQERN